MLQSSICHYNNTYILVNRIISVTPVPPPAANPNNNNKEVVFKSCSPFTDCISKRNNKQIGNAKDIDVVRSCII